MSGLNGDLQGMVEQLQEMRSRAEQGVREAEALLSHRKGELTTVNAMLRSAGALTQQTKPKPKPKIEAGFTPETRGEILAEIRGFVMRNAPVMPDVPWSFLPSDLAEASDFHETTVRKVVNALREEGVIRAVGRIPLAPGARGRTPMAFALVNDV